MAYTTKTCERCCSKFNARNNARFCCSHCRWSFHAEAKYMAIKAKGPKEMGRANRLKGQRAEREVCALLSELTGDDVSRNLSQTRDSGGDVEWGPFLFEVKYQKTMALPAWQRQAQASAEASGHVPAVVYRRPQEKFWISLPFETFVTLFEVLRRAAEAKTP